MNPLSSLNINNDLLTCFGTIEWPPYLFSATFDPENNFEEIVILRDYKNHPNIVYANSYIYSKVNKKKKKAIIYIVFNAFPFWATFDYTNKFSSIYKESIGDGNYFHQNYWEHKIFYFEQTSEFVIASLTNSCDKFIMVYNNFNIIYKGILPFNDDCSYSDSFTILFQNNNYTVLVTLIKVFLFL